MFQNVEMRHQSKVSFAEYSLFYRALLQKKGIILKQFALMFQNVEMRHQSHCLFYRSVLQKKRLILK